MGQITAVLANETSNITVRDVLFDIKISDILVKIKGGENRIVDYKKPLMLNGSSRDLDIEDILAPQDITFAWKCIDLLLSKDQEDQDCLNYKKIKLIKDEYQGKDTFTIPENQLVPYTTLKFSLTGNKDSRSCEDFVIVIISELDIPPLEVVVENIKIYTDGISLNEEFIATMNYNQTISTDLLTFAGSILYENKLVGAIVFDYIKVRFKIWNYYDRVTPDNKIVQVRFSVFNPQFVMPSLSIINIKINLPPQNCQFSVSPLTGIALSTTFKLTLTNCIDENIPLSYQFFYYKKLEDSKMERNNPNCILRRQISDQNYYSEIETLLPEGDIVLMAWAIDSLQAIYNITQVVTVKPLSHDEPSLLLLIDSFLSPNTQLQLLRNRVLDLSLLGEELSNQKSLYQTDTFSQKKTSLISTLFKESKMLPKSSSLQTFSNKVIGQLQKSLSQSAASQNMQILGEVDKILSSTESSSSSNSLNINNEIHTQNIFDSFQILTATVNEQKGEDQNTYSTLLSKQIDISDKIGDLMNSHAFPNEGQKILQSDSIIIKSEKITAKYLGEYVSYNRDTSNSSALYDIAFKYHQKNMYLGSESFKNYTSKLEEIQPGIKYSTNQVISPSIKINENQGKNFTFEPILKFSNTQSNNQPMTCIQLNNNVWTNKNCLLHQIGNSQSYECLCKKLSPTTIIEDAEALLTNKNIQTAFGSQGLENISNFDNFYEYGVFWLLSSATLMQVILWRIGKRLDLNLMDADINNKPINFKVASEPKETIRDSPKHQQDSPKHWQDSPLHKQDSPLYKQDSPLYKKDQKEDNNTIMIGNIKTTSLPVHQDIKAHQDEGAFFGIFFGEINREKSIQYLSFPQETKKKLEMIYSNQSLVIESGSMPMKDEQQTSNKDIILINQINNNKEIQTEQAVPQLPFFKKPILLQLIIFHKFFNIFYTANDEMTRPIRFSIFYLQVVHQLAMSTLFDSKYKIDQAVIISLINSIVMAVFVQLIMLGHKKCQKVKYFTVFVISIILLFYYYLIFSVISGKESLEANKSALFFVVMFSFDFFFISFLVAYVQRGLAIIVVSSSNINKLTFLSFLFRKLKLLLILQSIKN